MVKPGARIYFEFGSAFTGKNTYDAGKFTSGSYIIEYNPKKIKTTCALKYLDVNLNS